MSVRAAIHRRDADALKRLLLHAGREELHEAFVHAVTAGYDDMVATCCTAACEAAIDLADQYWGYVKLASSNGRVNVVIVLKNFLSEMCNDSTELCVEHIVSCIRSAMENQQGDSVVCLMRWLRQLNQLHVITERRAYEMLMDAARFDHAKLVAFILVDTNLSASTTTASKAFVVALHHKSWSVVEMLIGFKCVDPSIENNMAIRVLAANGQTELIRRMIARSHWDDSIDPAAMINDPIIAAASNGWVDTVRLLCEDPRVNPGAEDNDALMRAAMYGHVDVVKYLMSLPTERGVDVNARNGWLLNIPILYPNIEMFRTVMACPRVNLFRYGNCAAINAIRYGSREALEMLLERSEVNFNYVTTHEYIGSMSIRELVDAENAARRGRVRRDLADALLELTPLPKGPASIVYQFVHNSVNPQVQTSFAPKVYDAMHA